MAMGPPGTGPGAPGPAAPGLVSRAPVREPSGDAPQQGAQGLAAGREPGRPQAGATLSTGRPESSASGYAALSDMYVSPPDRPAGAPAAASAPPAASGAAAAQRASAASGYTALSDSYVARPQEQVTAANHAGEPPAASSTATAAVNGVPGGRPGHGAAPAAANGATGAGRSSAPGRGRLQAADEPTEAAPEPGGKARTAALGSTLIPYASLTGAYQGTKPLQASPQRQASIKLEDYPIEGTREARTADPPASLASQWGNSLRDFAEGRASGGAERGGPGEGIGSGGAGPGSADRAAGPNWLRQEPGRAAWPPTEGVRSGSDAPASAAERGAPLEQPGQAGGDGGGALDVRAAEWGFTAAPAAAGQPGAAQANGAAANGKAAGAGWLGAWQASPGASCPSTRLNTLQLHSDWLDAKV